MTAVQEPVELTTKKRTRLRANERRESLLAAARKAFLEVGDLNGTTTQRIAAVAGVSEAVIYRHFASKEELFHDAVVEPLRYALKETALRATDPAIIGPNVTPAARIENTTHALEHYTAMFEETLPLLGLVLFGSPREGRAFYRDDLDPLLQTFERALTEREVGPWDPVDARAIVLIVMGTALVSALDARFGKRSVHRAQVTRAMAAILATGGGELQRQRR